MSNLARKWGGAALTAGLVVVGVLLLLVVSLERRERAYLDPDVFTEESTPRPLRRFTDPAARFTLLYPSEWGAQPVEAGVSVWPTTGGNFAERGAALYVLVQPSEASAPPNGLPMPLEEALQPDDKVREAEHVAVGGLGGVESVFKIPVAERSLSAMDANVRAALEGVPVSSVTAVTWQTEAGGQRYWVVMLDARDGAYLPRLEQIRDTIQWQASTAER